MKNNEKISSAKNPLGNKKKLQCLTGLRVLQLKELSLTWISQALPGISLNIAIQKSDSNKNTIFWPDLPFWPSPKAHWAERKLHAECIGHTMRSFSIGVGVSTLKTRMRGMSAITDTWWKKLVPRQWFKFALNSKKEQGFRCFYVVFKVLFPLGQVVL